MPEEQPIRVIKKVSGHGGHHGGAWKVALADFMTAMMAFFLVMWILGLNEETRKAVQGYFNDPIGFSQGYASGKRPFETVGFNESGNKGSGSQLGKAASNAERRAEQDRMEAAKQNIELHLHDRKPPTALANQVEMSMTPEGLRIELVDRREIGFFEVGSATLKPEAREILGMLGQQIAGLENSVIVEGHTDARQYSGGAYTNWELSVDRANAARRALVAAGRPNQVVQVIGYANTMPRRPDDLYHYSNRRVSILVRYSEEAMREKASPLADEAFRDLNLYPDFHVGP